MEIKSKRRVGIMGGSYDPIHIGHLLLAEYAKKELNLDYVIFIPCYESAYKNKVIQASPYARSIMIEKSIEGNDIISCCELMRGKVSYTIDTVKRLLKDFKKEELILLGGIDTEIRFDSWKESDEIKRLIEIKYANKDFYVPQIGISSTLVRDLVKKNKSIKYLVPKVVENYIIKSKLYK